MCDRGVDCDVDVVWFEDVVVYFLFGCVGLYGDCDFCVVVVYVGVWGVVGVVWVVVEWWVEFGVVWIGCSWFVSDVWGLYCVWFVCWVFVWWVLCCCWLVW